MKYVTDSVKAMRVMSLLEGFIYGEENLNQPFDTMTDDQFRAFQARLNDPVKISTALRARDVICLCADATSNVFYEVLGMMVMSNGGDITPFREHLITAICDDEDGDADRQNYLKYYLQEIRLYHNQPIMFNEFLEQAFAPLQ